MIRLSLLVEGDSDEKFVRETLKPFLAKWKVYIEDIVNLKGVSSWKRLRKDLKGLIEMSGINDSSAWVTTLLDFYGLPAIQGYAEIPCALTPREQVQEAQRRLEEKINHPRFIPFLALHEFEAWLFSAPDVAAEYFGQPELANKMREIVVVAGEPELINHGVNTHPKARLKSLGVGYKETSDGPILLEKIGIETIQAACPHFSAWIDRLQALASPPGL